MRSRRLFLAVLPCLRCARRSVALVVPLSPEPIQCPDLMCEICGARHFFAVLPDRVIYDRDTRRYPSEYYDDNEFPIILLRARKRSQPASEDESTLSGPITIFERKKRFSSDELGTIFSRSKGKCHLCGHGWALADHGRRGWHVDHVIPN